MGAFIRQFLFSDASGLAQETHGRVVCLQMAAVHEEHKVQGPIFSYGATAVAIKSSWAVYIMYDGTRSYVGCTTDCHRRRRQHKKLEGGGAKTTASMDQTKLELCAVAWPLRGQSEAERVEGSVKQAHGLKNRVKRMFRMAQLHGWSMGMLAANPAQAAMLYGITVLRFTDYRFRFTPRPERLSKLPGKAVVAADAPKTPTKNASSATGPVSRR